MSCQFMLFRSISIIKAISLCLVTVELPIKRTKLLNLLLKYIFQYKRYRIIDIRHFFSEIISPKMRLCDPCPLTWCKVVMEFYLILFVLSVLCPSSDNLLLMKLNPEKRLVRWWFMEALTEIEDGTTSCLIYSFMFNFRIKTTVMDYLLTLS